MQAVLASQLPQSIILTVKNERQTAFASTAKEISLDMSFKLVENQTRLFIMTH